MPVGKLKRLLPRGIVVVRVILHGHGLTAKVLGNVVSAPKKLKIEGAN
jgi:hypothetical protein